MGKNKKKMQQPAAPVDIEMLRARVTPVLPEDSMAEAGRKILLNSLVHMLEREAGSRTGEDIEDVHKMRVVSRHMRSAFRLFLPYYKQKTVRPFIRSLRKIGSVLGRVRDLDVMVYDMMQYQSTLAEEDAGTVQAAIDRLEARRQKARARLIAFLDSPDYLAFVAGFSEFLLDSGEGIKQLAHELGEPYQVRHVLPIVMHQHLAVVRAYETVIDGAPPSTLHALRIDFKRLRYLITHFEQVLGQSAQKFVDDIKQMQDYLGRMNDIEVACRYFQKLSDSKRLDDEAKGALQTYIAMLRREDEQRSETFPSVWEKFNTRTVQRKLADALLVLR